MRHGDLVIEFLRSIDKRKVGVPSVSAKRKDEEAKASSGKDTFLDAFNKNIYGASSSGGLSLEEAVGRRKFYSERGGGRSSNGFRK